MTDSIYELVVHFGHSHLLDDLRGPLQPSDSRSHITRINDWIGSDSWVQGCRVDKPPPEGYVSDYPEPKLPYQLLRQSYHDGAMRRASEVVWIEPSKRGSQHAKIPGQEYPDLPEPPAAANDPLKISDSEIPQLVQQVASLEGEVRRLATMLEQHIASSKPAETPPVSDKSDNPAADKDDKADKPKA